MGLGGGLGAAKGLRAGAGSGTWAGQDTGDGSGGGAGSGVWAGRGSGDGSGVWAGRDTRDGSGVWAGRGSGDGSGTWAGRDTGDGSGGGAGSRVGDVAEPDARGGEATRGRKPAVTPRRGAADPVKALMHRHRELCERAVDPLEIAAALEAHDITDRTAARFRHRDVFSLAEEMFARVPRGADTSPSLAPPPTAPPAHAEWIVRGLLPGAVCAATLAGLRVTHGQTRLAVAAVGLVALVLAVRAALIRGPLSARRTGPASAPPATGVRVWACWLLAYAVLGDGLLTAVAAGGPDALPTGTADSAWPVDTAVPAALVLSCAPAALSAQLLAAGARRRLTASRDLKEFTAAVRPLLLGAFALYLAALAGLHALSAAVLDEPAAYARTLTLGALLLLARLLATHGFRRAPALVLGVAAAAEATAVSALLAARLPGCGFLATPVQILLDDWGPGSVPVLVCGAGALALLIHAGRTLTRASAHALPRTPACVPNRAPHRTVTRTRGDD
ncbi:hypothetical protein [Streptomyces sp.]|uniref:hypothetical protein n=1 Tax=Streptomyces sp. TaxID=1931 RepID=UPI0039C9D793